MTDTKTEHACQSKGYELREGDRVLINDRQRPVTVDGVHKRQQTGSHWRYHGESKYHRVVELEGNGTEYHLLCTGGSSHGPMLYKESEWDEDQSDKMGQRPAYSRGGERVRSIEVVE